MTPFRARLASHEQRQRGRPVVRRQAALSLAEQPEGSPMTGTVTTQESIALCMDSYVRGAHDLCDTMLEMVNAAQEHAVMTAAAAQAIRVFITTAQASLPTRPAHGKAASRSA